tara:strand:+ start:673 stop:852 length:180 start_codon:yes stop_codon:yes gene_type:complete
MENSNNEKIYIGRSHRFIVQQTVGFSKVLECLRERFDVKELKDDSYRIVLIEEKEDEKT